MSNTANYVVTAVAGLAATIGGVQLIRGAMARRSKTTIVLKMLTNYLQMLSALRVFLSAKDAPSGVKSVISIASVANYVSLDFQSLSCSATLSYYTLFTAYMLIPPGAAIVPAFTLFAGAVVRRIVSGTRIDINKIGRITVTAVGVLLFFTQNTVVVQALQTWNCASTAEGGYLRTKPTISCYSDQHILLRYIITPVMVVLYGIGIPALAVLVLWRVRPFMDRNRTLKYYGFMFDGCVAARTRGSGKQKH